MTIYIPKFVNSFEGNTMISSNYCSQDTVMIFSNCTCSHSITKPLISGLCIEYERCVGRVTVINRKSRISKTSSSSILVCMTYVVTIMVISIECRISGLSSISSLVCFIHFHINALVKGMNLFYLLLQLQV